MGVSDKTTLTPIFHASLSHVLSKSLRHRLAAIGYDLRTGRPKQGDAMLVWGGGATAQRSLEICEKTGAQPIYAEDAWLRSLMPHDRLSYGLTLDTKRPHYDATAPSDLEAILAANPFDDAHLMMRAKHVMQWLKASQLTKYSATRTDLDLPKPGYVLVIDQTHGDAAVTASGGDRSAFVEMLVTAQEDHPGAPVLIKTHPATTTGAKQGYFTEADATHRVSIETRPLSPWQLFEGAIAVYTYSSQLGLEAILAGHKPHVFGQPFYAGWGLTHDHAPIDRRTRILTRAQLIAGSYLIYPKWFDLHSHQSVPVEHVLASCEARTRAWRDDHLGWTASNMRLWKRGPLSAFFGQHARVHFSQTPRPDVPHMTWGRSTDDQTQSVEDGFIRSRGLGAALVPPLSLVLDDHGIYFDATRPSRLDHLIAQSGDLGDHARSRVTRLIDSLQAHQISKYNLDRAPETAGLLAGYHLVLGQVEDDASIEFGAFDIRTNDALLQRVRQGQPDATIVYKPHPDVQAGLRQGAVTHTEFADHILENANITQALEGAIAVHTITSLGGFEALLRGVPVHCYGMPFYAGWGLTHDTLKAPHWRRRHVELWQLAHAALIDYPRYFDPIYMTATSPERVIALLANGLEARQSALLRLLAKLQGWAVSPPFDRIYRRRK